MSEFSHINNDGKAKMVDVGHKKDQMLTPLDIKAYPGR